MQEMQEIRVPSLGQEDALKQEMGNQIHHSCLENPMNREAWQATVHGVTKSQTRLNTHTTERIFFFMKTTKPGKKTLCVYSNLLNFLFLYKIFLFLLHFGTCIYSPLLQIQNCNSVLILNKPAFAAVIFGSLLISDQYQLLKFIVLAYIYHVLCVFVGIFWHKINYCIAIKM